MDNRTRLPVWSWVAKALGAVALVAGLAVAAQPAQAAYSARITAYIPGAPAAAWVVVQHQDTASGSWQTVSGWEGALSYTRQGVPYKQWAVSSDDYGKGTYRWVVYVEQGGAVWATSDGFNLPKVNGVNQTVTVTGTVAVYNRAPRRVTTPPVLAATTENVGFDTQGGEFSRITASVSGVSPTAYLVVQYQDVSGGWKDVAGWQSIVTVDARGLATVQWGVEKTSFGQGPLRWVIYGEKGGTIVGYSPTFNLPTDVGVNFILHLSV